MPPQKKSLLQYIGVIITGLSILVGIVSAYAIQSEKVKTLEQKTFTIESREEKYAQYNTDEHKAILQALADIKAVLRERRAH